MAWNIDNILTMDPAQIGEALTDESVNNICDQLVGFDPANAAALRPALAERWDISADGRTYTFHLRRGIRHPSGNPVTPEDAAWNIRRVMWLGFGNAANLGKALGASPTTPRRNSPPAHRIIGAGPKDEDRPCAP